MDTEVTLQFRHGNPPTPPAGGLLGDSAAGAIVPLSRADSNRFNAVRSSGEGILSVRPRTNRVFRVG